MVQETEHQERGLNSQDNQEQRARTPRQGQKRETFGLHEALSENNNKRKKAQIALGDPSKPATPPSHETFTPSPQRSPAQVRDEDATSDRIPQTKIKLQIKSKEQRVDYVKIIQREFAQQDFEYPDVDFEPVDQCIPKKKKLSMRQKKVYQCQHQLFGRDLLDK